MSDENKTRRSNGQTCRICVFSLDARHVKDVSKILFLSKNENDEKKTVNRTYCVVTRDLNSLVTDCWEIYFGTFTSGALYIE